MARNREQGPGGATHTKGGGGEPRSQGEGGASNKGPSISQKGGKIPFNSDGQDAKSTGDNRTPHRALSHTPSNVRGGGTVIGHDSVNPNAGKATSGSKDEVSAELGSKRGSKGPKDGLSYLKK